MSNSLDPDQVPHFVGPHLGPNSLQRLSADNTSRHIVKDYHDKKLTSKKSVPDPPCLFPCISSCY